MEKPYIWMGYFSRISKMIGEDGSGCVVQVFALPSSASSRRKIAGPELNMSIIAVIEGDVIPIIHVTHKVAVDNHIVKFC